MLRIFRTRLLEWAGPKIWSHLSKRVGLHPRFGWTECSHLVEGLVMMGVSLPMEGRLDSSFESCMHYRPRSEKLTQSERFSWPTGDSRHLWEGRSLLHGVFHIISPRNKNLHSFNLEQWSWDGPVPKPKQIEGRSSSTKVKSTTVSTVSACAVIRWKEARRYWQRDYSFKMQPVWLPTGIGFLYDGSTVRTWWNLYNERDDRDQSVWTRPIFFVYKDYFICQLYLISKGFLTFIEYLSCLVILPDGIPMAATSLDQWGNISFGYYNPSTGRFTSSPATHLTL